MTPSPPVNRASIVCSALALGAAAKVQASEPPGRVTPLQRQPPISTQGFDLREVELADPGATPETVSLFAYLKNVAKTHLLFGHQLTTAVGFSVSKKDGTESDVLRAVGAFPAVYGWDALTISGQGETDFDLARLMRAAYDQGGINTLSAHMHNFVSGGDFWDTTPAVAHVLPGGSHHQAFAAYLDQIADFAHRLQDAQGRPIPIIFRPFHEHTGSWFWWGAAHCSADEYQLLFRFTVEYLRDQKGVHNFLYAYSPATHFAREQEYLSRYPGDAYVDLLGVDGYDDDLTGGWIQLMLRDLRIATKLATKKGKVAVVAETGPTSHGLGRERNPNKNWYSERWLGALKRDPEARRVAYMLVWRNGNPDHFWVPYRGHPTFGDHEMLDDFVRFYNDERTVFNDQLKDVYRLQVKVAPSAPVTYLAFPMNRQKVAGDYEVRVKADGRGGKVERVLLQAPDATESELSLRDGYYRGVWDFGQAELGRPATITARAHYAGGLVQSARATVLPVAKNLRRFTFYQDLEGLAYDGTYAAAGSVHASVRHSDGFGGGALVIDANLKDDGKPDNWTYQEVRVRLPLEQRVDLEQANKVRFDLFLSADGTSKFYLEPGVRFYHPGGRLSDFVSKGAFTTELPVAAMGGARYHHYAADIDLSASIRGATSMAVQFVAKDATYRGPVYLDNLKFLAAAFDAPSDPRLVDDFESYAGSVQALSDRYTPNHGGNTVRLGLDQQIKSSGRYGLRYHYRMGSPNYAGVTRVFGRADWRRYGEIQFWFKPDSKDQNLVIQITASGKPFEIWLPMRSLKEGRVRIPLGSLKRPRWAPDAGVPLDPAGLGAVSAFSIYINADPGTQPHPFESDLYFDDIRVTPLTPG